MRSLIGFLIFFIPLLILFDVNAVHAAPPAYIDPNTGGMLFQMLAVVFTLLSGLIFFFSSRIKMALARMKRYLREKIGESLPQNIDSQSSEAV